MECLFYHLNTPPMGFTDENQLSPVTTWYFLYHDIVGDHWDIIFYVLFDFIIAVGHWHRIISLFLFHIICWVFVRFLDQTYYIWSRFKKKILGHAHLSPNIKSFPVIFSRSLRAIVFGAQTRIDSSTTTTSVYRRKDFLMLLKLAILSIMNKSSKIRIWQITIVK